MHTLNAIALGETDTEDALKVLGRVADAFDSPPTHKTDKELKLFMVNVVKSHHLLTVRVLFFFVRPMAQRAAEFLERGEHAGRIVI